TSSRKEWGDHQVAATRETKRREAAAKLELEDARRLLATAETKEKQLGLRETEFRAKEAQLRRSETNLERRESVLNTGTKDVTAREAALEARSEEYTSELQS